MSYPRTVCQSLILCLLLLASAQQLHAAGYVKKWIWTKKEEKELKKLEKEVKEKDSFHTLETDHWIIKTTIDPRFTAETGLFMEIFYDVFMDAFGFKKEKDFAKKEKQTVVIFSNQNAYMSHGAIPGSRGYYSPGDYEICTYMEEGRLLTFSNCYHPVIQHEGTHALFDRMMGRTPVPVWLNEGMATFYEYWDYRTDADPTGRGKDDKKARRMRLTLSQRKHRLREWVRDNGGIYPKFSYVVGLVSHKQWNVDNMGPITGFHYGAAECVADFLLSDKRGQKFIERVFKRMDENEVVADSDGYASLKNPVVTDEDIEELSDRWYDFIEDTWGINGKPPKDDD